ncbi:MULTISPECIES: hypothetical protein [Burkholderia]|uniref:hypothetical protein n=1 Tax=Burkholderia TaxID=32008 RepID=UPI000568E97F|nr:MULTISPECIES: hypothetical protein [Burkholderia]MCM2482462.1 hypothetical protein [Burkholderia glumae]MCM2507395.1 hypothetical protein [Burkholderia glumae]MDR8077437.1 hypothetical protein [Burkholderia cenocepacia]
MLFVSHAADSDRQPRVGCGLGSDGALEAAKRTEDEVGVDNLGPWSDFEWGMLNGKLSALRWILGDEWDMLDT